MKFMLELGSEDQAIAAAADVDGSAQVAAQKQPLGKSFF